MAHGSQCSPHNQVQLRSQSQPQQPKAHHPNPTPPQRPTSPLDLPLELFNQIMSHMQPQDLYQHTGVSRQWRARLSSNKFLWKKLYFGMLRRQHQKAGIQRLAALAGGSFDSLLFDSSLPGGREILKWTAGRFLREVRRVELDCDPLGSVMLGWFANKASLRVLDFAARPPGAVDEYVRAMQSFPGLEDLTVRDLFLPEPPTVHPGGLDWGPAGCCSKLKMLCLVGYKGMPASNAQLGKVGVESLAAAAPNLEAVVLEHMRIGKLRGMNVLDDEQAESQIDFHRLTHLKGFTARNVVYEFEHFPLLPPSLETLVLLIKCRQRHHLGLLECADLPALPALKLLEANIDAPTVGSTKSMWFAILSKSGCKLRELTMRAWTRSMNEPDLSHWQKGWGLEVCHELLQKTECLQSVERLCFHGFWSTSQPLLPHEVGVGLAMNCPKLCELAWFGACLIDVDSARQLIFRPGVPWKFLYLNSRHFGALVPLALSRHIKIGGFVTDSRD